MRGFLVLFVHLVVTTVRLVRPGGVRAVVAESLLLKQQLLIVTRSRRRAPVLRPLDRAVAVLCAGLMERAHIRRCAIVLKPVGCEFLINAQWVLNWNTHPCRAQKFHPAMALDPFPAKLSTSTRVFLFH